jgi:type I restriction enzyme M protein
MVETALADEGRVGVIVPHGVLFRGGSEGAIRKQLIEENLLKAVIGLPANLFYGTGIPAAMLIFDKGKTTSDVLFIDASREFQDDKRQNRLRSQDIDRIVSTFQAFQGVPRYAHRTTVEQVRENDYNLNIPRYVDTSEDEEEIDVGALQEEIDRLESKLAETRKQMTHYLEELGFTRTGG